MSLWGLFWIFLYVGAFTIGGGLVAISLMQQELVGRGLISVERFYNMVAISESTPGPIGINMATYIGFELHGVFGGIITTIGTVLPSLVIIIIIAQFFGKFQDIPIVKAAFNGLRAGTTGMIGVAAFQIIRVALFRFPEFNVSGNWLDICSWPALGLFVGILVIQQKLDWHPVFFIVLGATFGVFFL